MGLVSASLVGAKTSAASVPPAILAGNLQAQGVINAFSGAKYKIANNSGDISILVIGDSTGVGTTRWVYKFAQWLAAQYPTHSVSYRAWDDVGLAYAAQVVLGTGTGANTIRVWNACVSGTAVEYLLGSKYADSIAAVNPDCIIWNHGENMATQTLSEITRGRFIAAMEMVRVTFPTIPQAMVIQNPTRDDTAYDKVSITIRTVAALRSDVTTFDVYTKFMDQGKASVLYTDNVHPSDTPGTALYLQAAEDGWTHAIASSYSALPGWLTVPGSNILANGDFSAFTAALPDSWTQAGNGAISKELVIVDGAHAYSVKAVNGTTATDIHQIVSAVPYRNTYVTLAVRLYVEDGNTSPTGRVYLYYTGSPAYYVDLGDVCTATWKWYVIHNVLVSSTATQLGAYLYASPGTTAGRTVYFDRAIMVAGDIPRNMA